MIRKPTFGSKPSEVRLWTGHLSNVFQVEYFFGNSKAKELHINEVTFYQEKDAKRPMLKVTEEKKVKGQFGFSVVKPLRQILLEDFKHMSIGFPGKVVKGTTENSKVM